MAPILVSIFGNILITKFRLIQYINLHMAYLVLSLNEETLDLLLSDFFLKSFVFFPFADQLQDIWL